MTQYTIEHFERQHELLGQTPTSLYASQDIYVLLDDEESLDDIVSLMKLAGRFGVVVRESTPEEVHHVWMIEVELDYNDPDETRRWPSEEAEIVMQIKDW